MAEPISLVDSLALERIEVNLFRGLSDEPGSRRIFGGHVIAQALLAAYGTVEDRVCHSLHAYFIRPGDPSIPVLYEVDRARDGRSFTTRRVTAIQHGEQIFNLAASFQMAEDGFEHQAPMPAAPSPEVLVQEREARRAAEDRPPRPPSHRRRPIQIVPVDQQPRSGDARPMAPAMRLWMRAREEIGAHPHLHQAVLAYASDMSLLGTALRPHALTWDMPGFQSASLDHAIWFHRPSNFNAWHLYAQDSPSASGARGFSRGALYTEDGVLVASMAQEGLMRLRKGD